MPGLLLFGLRAFLNQIALNAIGFGAFDKHMPGFGTKMWNVDDGGGIIRKQANPVTGLERGKPFAQFQNGKRAKKPDCVKVHDLHIRHISQMLHTVHSLVTT